MGKASGKNRGKDTSQEYEQAIRRAEQWIDRAGETASNGVEWCGHEFRRLAARVREEAEDMWVEAQALREAARSRE